MRLASAATRWEREFLRVIEGGCSTPFGCYVAGDRAHLGIATERGWAAHSIDLPKDLLEDSQRDSFIRAAVAGCKPIDHSKLPLARSAELYARAEALIPAGVSSPVRAFRKVGGTPVFFREAQGAHVIDEDGNRYLDFCMAWGPLILGSRASARGRGGATRRGDGLAFGTAHRGEGELAERVLAAYPYAKLVRFVVSGTEAVATAVRIARASNGRRRILKFDGCYHGHVDSLMVKAGSGVITQGLADSAGVPAQVAADTLVIPLGDIAALEQAFREQGKDIAAAIIEPLPANNGLLQQSREYLQRLRELTRANGTVLIFDEVITGFRFGYHGYDKLLGIEPDLTTLGKIVGGGLPVAAVLGRRELLAQLAPLGPVYQAGTMAGNPVCLAAGIATLAELAEGGAYRHIEMLGKHLDAAFARHALRNQAQLPRVGPDRLAVLRRVGGAARGRVVDHPDGGRTNTTGVIVAGSRAASICRLRPTRCVSCRRLTPRPMSINCWTCWQRAIEADAISDSTVACGTRRADRARRDAARDRVAGVLVDHPVARRDAQQRVAWSAHCLRGSRG